MKLIIFTFWIFSVCSVWVFLKFYCDSCIEAISSDNTKLIRRNCDFSRGDGYRRVSMKNLTENEKKSSIHSETSIESRVVVKTIHSICVFESQLHRAYICTKKKQENKARDVRVNGKKKLILMWFFFHLTFAST